MIPEAYYQMCFAQVLPVNAKYEYCCSNYQKDEISARQAELQGEIGGLYTLTNKYRQERINQIKEFGWELERSIEYERTYGYNGDGSKK